MQSKQFPDLSDEALSKRIVHQAGPIQTAMVAELSRRQAEKSQQLLSGEAMYQALRSALDALVAKAPQDHDVLVVAFGLSVRNVRFIEPHTFIFMGFDEEGNAACAVAHFSQVVTKIIFRRKQGQTRVITGFAKEQTT